MSYETMIKSLRRQLRDLDAQRGKLLRAIEALQELHGDASENGTAPRKRRAGGSPLIQAALTALRNATKPTPVMELVAAVQRSGYQSNKSPDKVRASLVSAMLRRTDLFTKPGRGVYGLVEWGDAETK